MIFPTSSKKESTDSQLTISEFLPLGYLYILILGILAESLYYGLIGINFLSYASILDVLLGPIAILTDKPILLVFLVVIGSVFYYLMVVKGRKNAKNSEPKKEGINVLTAYGLVMAVMVLTAFVGYGLGKGMKERSNIAENKIEHDVTLHFLNGDKKEVRKLGNTSTFIFHIQKDQKSISISPISNNIKEIEQMK
jgi:heme/copper-type cytochrome/quinol oxidase subunit 2